jgi:hypothetical protein
MERLPESNRSDGGGNVDRAMARKCSTVQSAEVEKKIKSEAKIVDLGFRKHILAAVPDLQEPIPGNSSKEISLEFREGYKLRRSFGVGQQPTASSHRSCGYAQ